MTKVASLDSGFWQSKRVLVTGHTGFKGGWLSLWLQSLGAELKGMALEPDAKPSFYEVSSVAEGMEHQVMDVRNFEDVRTLMSDFRPEIIFHLAAQPLVRQSYKSPVETYETNIMGSLHVLEAARQVSSVRAIVNVTTDKCYENREWVWPYRESDPLGGNDPYSSSKACVELLSNSYRKSFLSDSSIAMATVRAGNVIGGGDWSVDRLIPDVLSSLQRRQTISIRNPKAIRPWQHVLEPLSGYIILAERLFAEGHKYAGSWNFGPSHDDVQNVESIVEKLCHRWGEKPSWSWQSGQHAQEAGILKLDISKAREELGWVPLWGLDLSLSMVVEWHKSWLAGEDMRAVSLDQIASYQAGVVQ